MTHSFTRALVTPPKFFRLYDDLIYIQQHLLLVLLHDIHYLHKGKVGIEPTLSAWKANYIQLVLYKRI